MDLTSYLEHAHAESLAKSCLLNFPSVTGQFVKHWKHTGSILQCQDRLLNLLLSLTHKNTKRLE